MDSRISRGGSNPYGHIWILTLKRFYAEGLQQIMQGICLQSSLTKLLVEKGIFTKEEFVEIVRGGG